MDRNNIIGFALLAILFTIWITVNNNNTEKNQILKGENAKGIDVSNLTSGLYFLQTELDGKVSNKRFVKY